MVRRQNKGGRKIYNIDKLAQQGSAKDSKGMKPKNKPNHEIEYGSGSNVPKSNQNMLRKKGRIPNIKRLEENILQCIIGQDEQVRQIITAMYRSIYLKSIKSNILIIGNSGTGKTETIKQIAKRMHLPYTIEDATKYTQEGYYGADVEDMIFNLIVNAKGNIEIAQKGIIIIDEIDKKAGHEEKDVSGVAVLKSLLKIIEGTTIKLQGSEEVNFGEIIDFKTEDIIIVFLGAFSGLEKIRNKRSNENNLGFGIENNKKIQEGMKTVDEKFVKEDLVEYGMPEEFVGRIDTIVEMNKLTKENLAMILKKSKLSIFRKYQAELREIGIYLSYNGNLFRAIAEKSLTLDTGARELSNTVNNMFENILYDIFNDFDKYSKCILEEGIEKNNKKYILS